MFSVTVLDILLLKGRFVLSPAQRRTGSERAGDNTKLPFTQKFITGGRVSL